MFDTERKVLESTTNHHKKFGSSVWEQDAAGSNPVTRTTFLRKTACLGGFSSFFVLVFVFKAIAVQRWFQGKKSDWSMSKDSR